MFTQAELQLLPPMISPATREVCRIQDSGFQECSPLPFGSSLSLVQAPACRVTTFQTAKHTWLHNSGARPFCCTATALGRKSRISLLALSNLRSNHAAWQTHTAESTTMLHQLRLGPLQWPGAQSEACQEDCRSRCKLASTS